MKNRKINFIKLGILLFGISFLLFNCEKDQFIEQDLQKTHKNKPFLKTVSIKEAKAVFNKRVKPINFNKENNNLELNPIWETTVQDSLSFTQELLTNTKTLINREGEYTSKIFFIKVNDSIVSAIKTVWVDEKDQNNNLKNGRIYFNDFNGSFLDAYKVTNGKLSYRLVPKQNTQEANIFSFLALLFQDNEDCWNTDNLPDGDGVFDEVHLGTINSDESGGDGNGSEGSGGGQDPAFTANNAAIHSFLTNGGISDVNGGGNSDNSSNEANNCPSDREWNSATRTCDCKDGKVETPTGACIDNPCANNDELVYNPQTGKCDCKDAKKTNVNGVCVDDTPCNRIKQQINGDIAYIAKKDELEDKTNLKKETGYTQNNNGTFSNALPVVNGGHSLTLGDSNLADIFGFIHTHLNNFPTGNIVDGKEEINQIYRIFSPADVVVFLKMVKASATPKKVYATVITSSGDYTLRFTGDTNDITGLKHPRKYKEDYINMMKKYKTNKERGFLHFLKDHINIYGIELYKLHKPLLSSTIKIQRKKLKSNGKVQTTNCE